VFVAFWANWSMVQVNPTGQLPICRETGQVPPSTHMDGYGVYQALACEISLQTKIAVALAFRNLTEEVNGLAHTESAWRSGTGSVLQLIGRRDAAGR
jgi:hypothetical protein